MSRSVAQGFRGKGERLGTGLDRESWMRCGLGKDESFCRTGIWQLRVYDGVSRRSGTQTLQPWQVLLNAKLNDDKGDSSFIRVQRHMVGILYPRPGSPASRQ